MSVVPAGCYLALTARLTIGFVFTVLAVAALAKLYDLSEFRLSLESWSLLPRFLRGPVTVAVPALELFVAGVWLLGVHRAAATVAGMAILTMMTSAYVAHVALAQPPDCSCLGKILAFESSEFEANIVIGRNLSLLGLLVFGGVAEHRARAKMILSA